MESKTDTLRVERRPVCTRTASFLRVLYTVLVALFIAAPLMAQSGENTSEANLKLPDLGSATFLGGIKGSSLLMVGLAVSALGLIFGLIIFNRLKNMAVHSSMREVSSGDVLAAPLDDADDAGAAPDTFPVALLTTVPFEDTSTLIARAKNSLASSAIVVRLSLR